MQIQKSLGDVSVNNGVDSSSETRHSVHLWAANGRRPLSAIACKRARSCRPAILMIESLFRNSPSVSDNTDVSALVMICFYFSFQRGKETTRRQGDLLRIKLVMFTKCIGCSSCVHFVHMFYQSCQNGQIFSFIYTYHLRIHIRQ